MNLKYQTDGSETAGIRHHVRLEVIVNRNVKTFTYLDAENKPTQQYVNNRMINSYFPNLDAALQCLQNNFDRIEAYAITCDRLVVGDNFFLNKNN